MTLRGSHQGSHTRGVTQAHPPCPHLHPDDGVDEEDHGDEEGDVGQRLWGTGRGTHTQSEEGVSPTPRHVPNCPRDVPKATWKDLTKVQSSVRIPSPLDNSFTSRITRNRRKKVMEMRELSSELWAGDTGGSEGPSHCHPPPGDTTVPRRRAPRSVTQAQDGMDGGGDGQTDMMDTEGGAEVLGTPLSPPHPPPPQAGDTRRGDTHVDLGDSDVHHAAHHDERVKRVPGVAEVVLGGDMGGTWWVLG